MTSVNPSQSREELENLEHILSSMKSFLFDYFQKLGPDPIENIQQIVNAVGKVFNSAATLYNRLDEDGLLKTWAIDVPPPGFLYEDKPEGHVCYMMTIKERSPSKMTAVEIPDLDSTPFKELDINVKNYNLKSYLAFPVALNEEVVGSLCVVFGQHRTFSDIDKDILEAFAKAVTLEEERKYAIETVKTQLKTIQGLNEEVSALNEQLKEENLRMSAELNVARQIQQMILPKPEELEAIAGLDIAGFMEPADEVGGDYYDVLHTDNIVTIGIGDVTGHGLESGLLMLMTQTAVRTLKEVKEHDPVRFLDTLNRTIYKNVQRMNSDRNLTLAVLNYSNGKLRISGQHEETIIVRKGGQIERIDTMDLGFPIGLDDDIADFVSHTLVELQPGDGVVVYTDGIPEAKNMDKAQYGIERLCEVISCHWEKSAEAIKQAIVADVRDFIGTQKIFDDITLLVLKKEPEPSDIIDHSPEAIAVDA